MILCVFITIVVKNKMKYKQPQSKEYNASLQEKTEKYKNIIGHFFTNEATKFPDLTGVTDTGKEVKLSEIVSVNFLYTPIFIIR